MPAAVSTQIVNAVVDSAGGASSSLDAKSADIAADARQAFSDATRLGAFTAAGFLALGFLATLRLTGTGRPEDEHDVQPAKQPAGQPEERPTS